MQAPDTAAQTQLVAQQEAAASHRLPAPAEMEEEEEPAERQQSEPAQRPRQEAELGQALSLKSDQEAEE